MKKTLSLITLTVLFLQCMVVRAESDATTIKAKAAEYLGIYSAADVAYIVPTTDNSGIKDASDYGQYVKSFTYNGDKIYGDINSGPTELYHLINTEATALEVARGGNLNIDWEVPSSMNGNIMLSAFADLDFDMDFEGSDDYHKKERGTYKSSSFGATTGTVTIPIPATTQLGCTRVRLRFDSSWNSAYDSSKGYIPANASTNRHVYDIIVKIVDDVPSTITVLTDGNGSVSSVKIEGATSLESAPYNNIKVPFGKKISMTAIADAGNIFDGWYDGTTKLSSASSFEYKPKTGETKTIKAVFVEKTYSVNIQSTAGGSASFTVGSNIIAMTQSNVKENTSITLSAVAKTGYKFVKWVNATDDSEIIVGAGSTYTPNGDITIKAIFEMIAGYITNLTDCNGDPVSTTQKYLIAFQSSNTGYYWQRNGEGVSTYNNLNAKSNMKLDVTTNSSSITSTQLWQFWQTDDGNLVIKNVAINKYFLRENASARLKAEIIDNALKFTPVANSGMQNFYYFKTSDGKTLDISANLGSPNEANKCMTLIPYSESQFALPVRFDVVSPDGDVNKADLVKRIPFLLDGYAYDFGKTYYINPQVKSLVGPYVTQGTKYYVDGVEVGKANDIHSGPKAVIDAINGRTASMTVRVLVDPKPYSDIRDMQTINDESQYLMRLQVKKSDEADTELKEIYSVSICPSHLYVNTGSKITVPKGKATTLDFVLQGGEGLDDMKFISFVDFDKLLTNSPKPYLYQVGATLTNIAGSTNKWYEQINEEIMREGRLQVNIPAGTPAGEYTLRLRGDKSTVPDKADGIYPYTDITRHTYDVNIVVSDAVSDITVFSPNRSGKYVFKCDNGNHCWTIYYHTFGTDAEIDKIVEGCGGCKDHKEPSTGHCGNGGCVLTIPETIKVDNDGGDITATFNRVGKTLMYHQLGAKEVNLPKSIIQLESVMTQLLEPKDCAEVVTDNEQVAERRWAVVPSILNSESWTFSATFEFQNETRFSEWGCALLAGNETATTYRDHPWDKTFQFWVDSNKRTEGEIKMANKSGDGEYFVDETGKRVNVLNKKVVIQIHNIPASKNNGQELIVYNVTTYDKNTGEQVQTASMSKQMTYNDINWVSQAVPKSVTCTEIVFYKDMEKLKTFVLSNSKESLPLSYSSGVAWVMNLDFIPDSSPLNIASSKANLNANSITSGFRLYSSGNKIHILTSGGDKTATVDPVSGVDKDFVLTAGNPTSITISRFPDTDECIVSLTDHIEMKRLVINTAMKQTERITAVFVGSDCTDEFKVATSTEDGLLFAGCSNLQEINVDKNNPQYLTVDGAVYTKDGGRLVRWPEGKIPERELATNASTTPYEKYIVNGTKYTYVPVTYFTSKKELKNLNTISALSMLNCGRMYLELPKTITCVEAISRTNSGTTFAVTPQHFNKITRGSDDILGVHYDEISFCLLLKQEQDANEGDLTPALNTIKRLQQTSVPFVQLRLPDRFGTTYNSADDSHAFSPADSYVSFSSPFDFKSVAEAADVFSELKYVERLEVKEIGEPTGENASSSTYGNRTLLVCYSDNLVGQSSTSSLKPLDDDQTKMYGYVGKLNPKSTNAGMFFSYRQIITDMSSHKVTVKDDNNLDKDYESGSRADGTEYSVELVPNIDKVIIKGRESDYPIYNSPYILNTKDEFVRVPSTVTTHNKGFRSYLDLAYSNPSSSAKLALSGVAWLLDEDDEATVIQESHTDNAQESRSGVFTLTGIKVGDSLDNLPMGIYIVNGRKEMKR